MSVRAALCWWAPARHMLLLTPLFACVLGACDDSEPCTEDERAMSFERNVLVSIGDAESLNAELATTPVESAAGWQFRTCLADALVIDPEAHTDGDAIPLFMCNVVHPLDLIWVRESEVAHVVTNAPTCAPPCIRCPRYGLDIGADYVIEIPGGTSQATVGAAVTIMPRQFEQ